MAATIVWSFFAAFLSFGIGFMAGLWLAWEMEHAEPYHHDKYDEDVYS